MLSFLRRLCSGGSINERRDELAEMPNANGLHKGFISLIADKGVWVPLKEVKGESGEVTFFDSEDCFPIFSSDELIVPYLQRTGVIDGTQVVSVPTAQLRVSFLLSNKHLMGRIVLNPGTPSEWRLTERDFAAIEEEVRQ